MYKKVDSQARSIAMHPELINVVSAISFQLKTLSPAAVVCCEQMNKCTHQKLPLDITNEQSCL